MRQAISSPAEQSVAPSASRDDPQAADRHAPSHTSVHEQGIVDPQNVEPDAEQEPPPFLSTWRNIYGLVLAELCITVILLYALTRWAS